jgi:apolipoprotein N-acyltransferase
VTRLQYVVAFFAGAATVLAFAPVGLFPLAIASFALLIHLWMRASARAAFWTGACFGLGLFGAGVSWIYVSLTQFGGMPPPVGVLATFLFCALLSFFPAAAGWLQARVPASQATRAWLVIPACWTLFEWLRGWLFSGFPWLSAGYASAGWPLQGFAPLLGVYALSFATLAAAGMIWSAVTARHRAVSIAAALALLGAGQALRAITWTSPSGEAFPAALLQGNIAQDLKFQPGRYAQTLQGYARLAQGTRARLIVLPETALPRFYDSVEPEYLALLADTARRNGGDVLLGVPYRDRASRFYNSVVSLGSSPSQVYHKTHLVPFGEFVPPGFRWTLRLIEIPLSDFSSGGTDQPPLRAAGQRIAVNVCYEDAFGEAIARQAREATLLVNMSNVAWFGDSLAPGQHLQIAQLRAVETGRMHLAATNTGITAAIDRDGRVLARLPQFQEGRLEIAAQGYTGSTPYVRLGDWPIILAAVLLLSAAAFVARRKATR